MFNALWTQCALKLTQTHTAHFRFLFPEFFLCRILNKVNVGRSVTIRCKAVKYIYISKQPVGLNRLKLALVKLSRFECRRTKLEGVFLNARPRRDIIASPKSLCTNPYTWFRYKPERGRSIQDKQAHTHTETSAWLDEPEDKHSQKAIPPRRQKACERRHR